MIKRFNFFINESDDNDIISDVEKVRKKFLKSLSKYEKYIVNNRETFDNINVPAIMEEYQKEFGTDVASFFNVETFFRKIHQILELHPEDIKRVSEEFKEYYDSVEERISEYSNIKEDESEYFDPFEGEESILPRKKYEHEKFEIQVELAKLQEWVMENNKRVAIVFEGRDTAGKGSTIKRFTEYLNPKVFKIVALGIPTEDEKNNWFQRYEQHFPKQGQIAFFDRSWYNRAVVEPSLGYCTENQYEDFMQKVLQWEESLIDDDLILIKFWFSITKEKQLKRFEFRKKSPIKYWKLSPNDEKVADKWDIITKYKNQMFTKTSSKKSPWVIISSTDKRVGRLNAMRYVLSVIPYVGKDESVCDYYSEVVNVID